MAVGKSVMVTSVKANQLMSNTEYQRSIDKNKVAKIVKEFDMHKLGVIKVSQRDGRYYVFDGQHRLAALIIRNNNNRDFLVKCEVHTGLSYEDEAKLFAEQYAGATKVSSNERFKALKESKDPDVLNILSIVNSVGLDISYTTTAVDNKIVCLNTLTKSYKKLGPDGFKTILDVVKQAWDGEYSSLTMEIIGGLTVFYHIYNKQIDLERLISRLRATAPVEIKRAGKSDHNASGDTRYAKAIFNVYNMRLSGKRRLEYLFKS